MPGAPYGTQVQRQFFEIMEDTGSAIRAAQAVNIHPKTGYNWIAARKKHDHEFAIRWMNRGKFMPQGAKGQIAVPLPGLVKDLSPDATRALEDFAYFRHRYLGRRSTPWQEEAAYKVVDWLNSDQTEYIVVNVAPGSGKSTLFCNDIPLWMICRDRTIRILIGSSTGKLAAQYTARIRRMLERTRPLPAAKDREEAAGCLAADFGRFKPDTGADIWRREEFTVLAAADLAIDGESSVEDKEPTVSSYGMDSEFLGARANLVLWDDLVTSKVLRSVDAVLNQQTWWEDEAETRLEPGGALVLQGQRLGPTDLYRFALDMREGQDDTADEDDDTPSDAPPKYRHIIYPAHFEDRCHGIHGKDAPPYPNGCLLDPVRLPWTGKGGLLTVQRNRMEKYRVVYQQEDTDPANVLVLPVWINGGKGADGIDYPGCWDTHRGFAYTRDDLPVGLSQPWYSVVGVDPSPTMYWAIEWWLYHPASEQRFLLDIHRSKMDAPDLLDWNENYKTFHGIMQDWQTRSVDLGVPIQTWIIEQNAAQRFILQNDAIKRWQRLHSVNILGHNTIAQNKLDETYGIQMLGPRYQYGNVRLPGKTGNWSSARAVVSNTLVREATRYPEKGTTDDCLHAQWFVEYHLPTLAKPRPAQQPKLPRPSFMKRAS